MSPLVGSELKRTVTVALVTLFLIGNLISDGVAEKEYFSSITGMEELLKTEEIILEDLKYYVSVMTAHIETLNREIRAIEKEHNQAANDPEGYLNNPVNAYLLIKRMHSDWLLYEDIIRQENSATYFLQKMSANRQNMSFSSDDDEMGSAIALARLQKTYQLDVSQLAGGILNGVKYGSAMTWQDCFALGYKLYSIRDYQHTIPWMKESILRLSREEYRAEPTSIDFMEAMASYHFEMGDFETSLNLSNQVLALDPRRIDSTASKLYLEAMIADGIPESSKITASTENSYSESYEFEQYERVCRGESGISPARERSLRCKYHTNNVAFRLIGPFKLEEMSVDPYIVVFHDVISNTDIENIKELSKPKMDRSLVKDDDIIGGRSSRYRISKSTWFHYEEHESMQRMQVSIHDLTGLDVTSYEELQVANYGIGGHYEPHFDFFAKADVKAETEGLNIKKGNRIATAIFYLSDVEQGGATAFPFLNISVKPKKGNVLFWYNLHRSEEPDYRTKHAGCPVLKGSKWISNVWIRSRNQAFARPCGLADDSASSLEYEEVEI